MIFGKETTIDLYKCKAIAESDLKQYVKELCKLIDMKPYGEPQIPYFGNDFTEGYTLVQLMETSSIVGHFTKDSAYINIFSCKPYNEFEAIEFTRNFFKARRLEVNILKRK